MFAGVLVTLLCGCVNVLTVVFDLMISTRLLCVLLAGQFLRFARNSVWSLHVVAKPVL